MLTSFGNTQRRCLCQAGNHDLGLDHGRSRLKPTEELAITIWAKNGATRSKAAQHRSRILLPKATQCDGTWDIAQLVWPETLRLAMAVIIHTYVSAASASLLELLLRLARQDEKMHRGVGDNMLPHDISTRGHGIDAMMCALETPAKRFLDTLSHLRSPLPHSHRLVPNPTWRLMGANKFSTRWHTATTVAWESSLGTSIHTADEAESPHLRHMGHTNTRAESGSNHDNATIALRSCLCR